MKYFIDVCKFSYEKKNFYGLILKLYAFDIFELILMKYIRNLALYFQAFLLSEKVLIEDNLKNIYKI